MIEWRLHWVAHPITKAKHTTFPSGKENMSIRVLLVDDHNVVRKGLQMFLKLDDEIEVVGEADGAEKALTLVEELQPDIVLMDLVMPGKDGVWATEQIHKNHPGVGVIALTSFLEDEKVIGVVRAGAIGYLLKDTDADELCQAIKLAAQGEVQLSPDAAARLVREVRAPDSPESLTPREVDVLRLIAQGLANKEIAASLTVSEKTVKTHVSSILQKLNLLSRTQAALYAVKIGLVD